MQSWLTSRSGFRARCVIASFFAGLLHLLGPLEMVQKFICIAWSVVTLQSSLSYVNLDV